MFTHSAGRTPQGVRGLKPFQVAGRGITPSRTPQGVRGLKPIILFKLRLLASRTPQGVRGLKRYVDFLVPIFGKSHSARSAWIETNKVATLQECYIVALRKECVD